MQIISITRWEDETGITLDEVEKKLLEKHVDDISDNTIRYINWSIEKKLQNKKIEKYNGKEVDYKLFEYSVDLIPVGVEEIDDDNVSAKTGFVIVYSVNKGKVRYVINRNSGAQSLLRKMLSYDKKGEIVQKNVKFTADNFIWLISKVYNNENVLEGGSEDLQDLTIDTIRGFKGNTEDLLTTVSTEGETVINIISTLSFLIESRNLRQINVGLAYKEHSNIEVTIYDRNKISINVDRYMGDLLTSDQYEMILKIVLTLYLEIITIIIQNYQNDVEMGLWNKNKCVDFLQSVAENLQEKVKNRIEELKETPDLLT